MLIINQENNDLSNTRHKTAESHFEMYIAALARKAESCFLSLVFSLTAKQQFPYICLRNIIMIAQDLWTRKMMHVDTAVTNKGKSNIRRTELNHYFQFGLMDAILH